MVVKGGGSKRTVVLPLAAKWSSGPDGFSHRISEVLGIGRGEERELDQTQSNWSRWCSF